MDCWTLFFNGLSAIATVGLLVCTIIGFWFIRKQIKIAKNRDIFSQLQNDISHYVNYYKTEHDNIYYAFRKLIIKRINKDSEKNEILKKMTLELDKVRFKPLPNTYQNIKLYEWWLGKALFKEIRKIHLSEEHKMFRKFYKNFEELKNKYKLNSLTKDDRTNEWKRFESNYKKINNEYNKILLKIAKEKGIS